MVLELGANDGLRGQSPEVMKSNLQAIIDEVRGLHPDVKLVIAGMEAPPNMGSRYVDEFRAVFPALAAANDGLLIPFLLDGVAAKPKLNIGDGIHPNADGYVLVVDNVLPFVLALLGEPERIAEGSDGSEP